MKITFYNNSADEKVLNKLDTLTPLYTTDFDVYNVLNVLSPNFIADNKLTSLLNANYCYVEELGKYYYCTVSIYKHQTIVNCRIDSITSNMNGIKNLLATAIRNEYSQFSNYPEFSTIPDDTITTIIQEDITQYKLQDSDLNITQEGTICFTTI